MGNYKTAGKLQNNTVSGGMSITVNRVIIIEIIKLFIINVMLIIIIIIIITIIVIQGWYRYDGHESCPIFRIPVPPYPSMSEIFPPPWSWTFNFKRTPSFFQIITSQLKKNIIQGWLLYVIRSFLQVSFRFQYQLNNIVWLPFDFFLFSLILTICFFVALYPRVCSCPKISRNVFYL